MSIARRVFMQSRNHCCDLLNLCAIYIIWLIAELRQRAYSTIFISSIRVDRILAPLARASISLVAQLYQRCISLLPNGNIMFILHVDSDCCNDFDTWDGRMRQQ